ncbi:efflux RND transporter periplasmic adaptor subunit [Hydrogenimonas sp.]
MKKVIKVLIIVAIVALLGVLGVRAIKQKQAVEAMLPVAKEYAVVVHTIEPKMQRVTLTLPYIAIAENENSVTIASKLAARILFVKHAGDTVRQGEIVARLDTTDLKAKLESINAQIEAAKEALEAKKSMLTNLLAIHKRTEALLRVKGASIEQYESEASRIEAAKAGVKEAFSRIKSLKANRKEILDLLTYAKIVSPVDGTVSKVFASVGDMAMPGKPLMKINAQKGVYLIVRAPRDIRPEAIVYKGQLIETVDLRHTFNGLEEYRADLKVTTLTAGERVDVDVVTYRGKGIKLPMDALLDREGKTYVLAAEGERAKVMPVTIKARGQEGVVIGESSIAGKRIITEKPDILLKLLSGVAIKTIK